MKVLLLILIFSVLISGQVKKRPLQPKPKTPTIVPETPSKPPFVFSENLEVLPTDYQGNTLIEIANAANRKRESQEIRVSPPTKDEFETSEQYARRLNEYRKTQQSLQSAKPFVDKYVLVLNYQFSDYDADNEILNIRTAFTYVDNKSSANLKSTTEMSSYTASNNYGATVTVTKTNMFSYGIEFGGYSADPLATAQIKLDIPTAKSVKPNLRTLIIFELIPPFSKSESTEKTPTLYSPLETINSSIKFIAKPIEIWFFDKSTGKVLAKKKIEEVKE